MDFKVFEANEVPATDTITTKDAERYIKKPLEQ